MNRPFPFVFQMWFQGPEQVQIWLTTQTRPQPRMTRTIRGPLCDRRGAGRGDLCAPGQWVLRAGLHVVWWWGVVYRHGPWKWKSVTPTWSIEGVLYRFSYICGCQMYLVIQWIINNQHFSDPIKAMYNSVKKFFYYSLCFTHVWVIIKFRCWSRVRE